MLRNFDSLKCAFSLSFGLRYTHTFQMNIDVCELTRQFTHDLKVFGELLAMYLGQFAQKGHAIYWNTVTIKVIYLPCAQWRVLQYRKFFLCRSFTILIPFSNLCSLFHICMLLKRTTLFVSCQVI